MYVLKWVWQTETVREMLQDIQSPPFCNDQTWQFSVNDGNIWLHLSLWCDPHVTSVPSGSSLHPDLRGPSVPSSPSCTPNTPTMLCSGNSEPNLNTPLNINLNSSFNSNYHTVFSSSTGLSMSSNLFLSFQSLFSIFPLFEFPQVIGIV